MTRIVSRGLGAASLLVAALVAPTLTDAAAARVDGLWRTEPRASGAFISVRIAPCPDAPDKRCGVVVGSHNGAPAEIVGDPIIEGMEPRGTNRWGGGEIIRPGRGTRYASEMELVGDALRVKGCAVAGLFCGAQVWTRP
ncbi:MAG: DUF2147 domain-containing protein [Paracoccaceae bacterium]